MPSNDGSPEPRHSSWSEIRAGRGTLSDLFDLVKDPGETHGPECIPGPHCFR